MGIDVHVFSQCPKIYIKYTWCVVGDYAAGRALTQGDDKQPLERIRHLLPNQVMDQQNLLQKLWAVDQLKHRIIKPAQCKTCSQHIKCTNITNQSSSSETPNRKATVQTSRRFGTFSAGSCGLQAMPHRSFTNVLTIIFESEAKYNKSSENLLVQQV